MLLQGTDELQVVAHILLDGGQGNRREVVGAQIDHHQVWAVGLEVVCQRVVVIKQTVVARQEVFCRLLLLAIVSDQSLS